MKGDTMKTSIDKLFVGKNIYTMAAEGDKVEAVGVKDGKIVFAGAAAQAQEQFDAAEVVRLKDDQAMLPGFGDSHLHFYAYCQTLTTVDLAGATTKAEALKRLSDKAKETPEGMWIKGSNFDQSKWTDCEDQIPTKEDLDKASDKHPIVIKRCCLHTAVANTMALEKANVGKNYDFGVGGKVELDADGMPNGILREQASKIYDELIPDPLKDPAVKKELMLKALKDASAKGVTMLHTYAAEIWKYTENFDDYAALDKEGLLPVRVTICLDELFEKPVLTKEEKEDPKRKVQYGTYKIFADGSLGSRSAALLEPYNDAPDSKGIMVIDQDGLNEKVLRGYEQGLQPAIHCIGDGGLDAVLTAIEYTVEKSREHGMTEEEQKARLPFRLIHVQMANEELIARMKKLPLILDIQPVFLITDLHWIEERIGAERAKYSYMWKRYQDEGFILTGSSDCPVESYDPRFGIYAAATRKDLAGYPEGGYHSDQLVSLYDAVAMYTKNIPYANGEQEYMGTIETGKFADLVIVDRDIFSRPAEDILNMKVEKTYLAGDEVYSAE